MKQTPVEDHLYRRFITDFLGAFLVVLPLVLIALLFVHRGPSLSTGQRGDGLGLAIILIVVVGPMLPLLAFCALAGSVYALSRFKRGQACGIVLSILSYPVGDKLIEYHNDSHIIALASPAIRILTLDLPVIEFFSRENSVAEEYISDLVLLTGKEVFDVSTSSVGERRSQSIYRAARGPDCLEKPELIVSMLKLIERGVSGACVIKIYEAQPTAKRSDAIVISERSAEFHPFHRVSRSRDLKVVDVNEWRRGQVVPLMRTLAGYVDGKHVHLPVGLDVVTKPSVRHNYQVNLVVKAMNASLGFDPTEEVAKFATLDHEQAIKLTLPYLMHGNPAVRLASLNVARNLSTKRVEAFAAKVAKGTRSPSGVPEWEAFQDQLLVIFSAVANNHNEDQRSGAGWFLAMLEPSRKEPIIIKKEQADFALISKVLRSDRMVDDVNEIQRAIAVTKGMRNELPLHIVALARTRIGNLTSPDADQEGILAVAYCVAAHKNIKRAAEIMALPHMVDRIKDEKWVRLTQGCFNW